MRLVMAGMLAISASAAAGYLHRPHVDVAERAASCRTVDGDTLNCDGERIRLNGIDAPEMPGHCRVGRACVPGDPFASRDHLRQGVDRGNIEITRLKTDRYGRTVAEVTADGIDLSCYQIGDGNAIYVRRWDEGGRTNTACE